VLAHPFVFQTLYISNPCLFVFMDIDWSYLYKVRKDYIGAHGARETPVPMPNTAVKPRSGYNTWGSPLGK
jgi:hypothetical protein